MSNTEKDATPCVYLRFQIPENKISSFAKMFARATQLDFFEHLSGVSRDTGNIIATCAMPIERNITTRGIVEKTTMLNMIFAKLLDFYPAFAEQPSTLHVNSAIALINSLKNTPAHTVTTHHNQLISQ